MNSKVSVVITTYNGTETLDRAISSVEAQTYKNIEIIVVDDNGLGTQEQVKTEEIVSAHKLDIKYIPHEINRNGSVARNTGINLATGEFIALLDDDDSFRPDKIEKQVNCLCMAGSDYALCYTGMMIHFQNGVVKEQITSFEGNIFEDAIMRNVKAQTSEFLGRADCIREIGGFDVTFRRHQDWEFFDRMAYKYKIAVVPEICIDRYIYKRTAATNAEQFKENRIYYLDRMKSYIEKLPKEKQKELYSFHYRSIAKEYLKNRQLLDGMKYLGKCGSPVITIKKLIDEYKLSSLV